MRVAVLISGYLRSFKKNLPNLQEKILSKFEEIDIYIHITDNENEDDKYFNHIEDINTIKKNINPKCLIVEPNLELDSNISINNLLNTYTKFYKLNQIKKINESSTEKYDLVIKYRPDLRVKSEIEFTFCQGIYLPRDSKIDKNRLQNIDDDYICDIFAFGDSASMDKYFEILNESRNLIEKYGVVPETVLYWYLIENQCKFEYIDLDYEVILSECNVFAICGDSGSGKSRLAERLKMFFSNSFLLECDRYHKWERGDKNWENYTHLNPDANYISKMHEDIFNLKLGNTIFQVDYDHKNGKFTEKSEINPSDNTIVCGLHSLYDNNESLYDISIFMDTDSELKKKWKIERDVVERGHSLENVLNQIEKRQNDFLEYIYPQKHKSDLIVSFFEKEQKLCLKLSLKDKSIADKIRNKLSERNIIFSIDINYRVQSFHFEEYTDVNIWGDDSIPKFGDYYDYIIFFIINTK